MCLGAGRRKGPRRTLVTIRILFCLSHRCNHDPSWLTLMCEVMTRRSSCEGDVTAALLRAEEPPVGLASRAGAEAWSARQSVSCDELTCCRDGCTACALGPRRRDCVRVRRRAARDLAESGRIASDNYRSESAIRLIRASMRSVVQSVSAQGAGNLCGSGSGQTRRRSTEKQCGSHFDSLYMR